MRSVDETGVSSGVPVLCGMTRGSARVLGGGAWLCLVVVGGGGGS